MTASCVSRQTRRQPRARRRQLQGAARRGRRVRRAQWPGPARGTRGRILGPDPRCVTHPLPELNLAAMSRHHACHRDSSAWRASQAASGSTYTRGSRSATGVTVVKGRSRVTMTGWGIPGSMVAEGVVVNAMAMVGPLQIRTAPRCWARGGRCRSPRRGSNSMRASTGPSGAVNRRTSIVDGRRRPRVSATIPSVNVGRPESVFPGRVEGG
jgi:hypothetical protein